MKERDEGPSFTNSFKEAGGLIKKIPDPSSGFTSTSKRPFDYFGALRGISVYIELKCIAEVKAMSFNRIADHQIENLLEFSNHFKNEKTDFYSLIAVIVKDRKKWLLFLFDINYIVHLMASGKKSIRKVDWIRLTDEGYSIPRLKGIYDLSDIDSKIIRK